MTIPRNTVQPVQDVPILQYASGHTEARPISGGRFAGFVGFHSEVGKDETFDAACTAAHVPQLEIRHPREGGAPQIVRHWSFGEAIRFFPVTAGPVAATISGCLAGRNASLTAEAGIGLAWPRGEKSRMAVRGLLVVGDEPMLFQLSVRSTMTGHLLTALLDHVRVCQLADDMIDRSKHIELVALHELALPLVSGEEVPAGKGETAQIAPLRSDHPADMSRAYVRSCWRKEAIHEAAIAAWPQVVLWAVGYRSGETNGDSHLEPREELL